ncbi:MAG: glycoside hydrolase family 18 protein [Bacteroidales bacterium]|nr:glycoside hydrolase family 18 protein [Bacteroidales bacterium]MDD4669688.1 glycoside hydrolase family 18 protein [Bacteroidales bacterium]
MLKQSEILISGALLTIVLIVISSFSAEGRKRNSPAATADKVVIAYVTSWKDTRVNPEYLTHINYAFGHVTDSFDGVRIDNPKRLSKIVKLKKKYPHLKVILSIGGWGSGNFSEMAADSLNRLSFAKDCAAKVKQYSLDGIDIDWEYPTSSVAKISSHPADTQNYTKMMRDIRMAIGPYKILSQATSALAKYIDFEAVEPYVDYTNVMSYDLGWAPYLNSPLYKSENVEHISADDAVNLHLAAGIPADKLVMGLAFYGRGEKGFPRSRDLTEAHLTKGGYTFHWDNEAMVPYLTNSAGQLAFGYENESSLALKCEYILSKGLKGAMYWSYDGDNESGDLLRTVFITLNED